MKVQGPIYLNFIAAILLQTWLLPFVATTGTATQLGNLKEHLTLEEQFTLSLSSFLPTASLNKDQPTLISHQCLEHSRLLVKSLLNRTEWALSSIYLTLFNDYNFS